MNPVNLKLLQKEQYSAEKAKKLQQQTDACILMAKQLGNISLADKMIQLNNDYKEHFKC